VAGSVSKKSKGRKDRKAPVAVADRKRNVSKGSVGKNPAAKKRKSVKKPSRQALSRQASQEMAKLRPILKDIGGALLDRLDGELAGLARSLGGEDLHGERPALPQPPVLIAMLADIKALKVKPKKGRVKDLGRLETLLESLFARMPPGA
jgi:hypothetical protein